jgi:hypothetical protein
MPSSKGLRITPGSLSTTSTNATVCLATRDAAAARRGLWRSRNRAGAAARDPKAPRDLADDIADAITSIRRSCDSRDRSAFSPIRKTLKSSLVDEK